ncbi:MAG TPA: electron transfer flavoprotein subunit beta/FixA family protein [Streptosporangiales bacterium]
MNIVVCVKQVPDTYSERKLDPGDKTLDRASADGVINELDEYAIEEALQLAEATSGTVTVLTMGPEKAAESIRKALSMGADKAVHVVDDSLHGADAVQTSAALAAALGTMEYDLVVLGSESTDARMSVVPAMLAERLGLPQLTYANKVEVDGSAITVQRQTEYGHDRVEATLPAVVSVVEKINEPRYPSFKGIMAAKKKEVASLGAGDLGLADSDLGLANAATEVVEFTPAPPKEKGAVVTDEGDGGVRIADYLAGQKIL